MNVDKAYLLGLIIGGGIFGNAEDIFRIRLPYKQWGSLEKNPIRAGQIAKDILRVVNPMFRNTYELNISYEASTGGRWDILCEGNLTELVSDLTSYGIDCNGEIRKNASIDKIVEDLVDDNLKRRFVAGLADTIGSTKSSHRRFTDNKQILSFEISGFRFDFVCSLCHLLYSINCFPDQILWNHPNFHCGNNPYDKSWQKGFKLRVLLDQYEKFGSFAFTSKATSVIENIGLQEDENTAIPCEVRQIHVKPACVHCDEDSLLLPDNIRGGHYLHNRHVCAVMQCPHAPFEKVNEMLKTAEYYVNPFPILLKNRRVHVDKIIEKYPIYKNRHYTHHNVCIVDLYSKYCEDTNTLLYGNYSANIHNGYPVNILIQAMAYVIAASNGNLNGNRPRGSKDKIIKDFISKHPNACIDLALPEILTPAIISLSEYSAMVGPHNPMLYKRLISFDSKNPYKVLVRKITEEDFIE